MTFFVFYDLSTGRITSAGETSAVITGITPSGGEGVAEGPCNLATDYISAGAVTPRLTVVTSIDVKDIQADGIDTATITGIPAGWSCAIDGLDAMVTDGSDIAFTAVTPGAYIIKFTQWPYQDVEFTINATDAY